MKQNTVAQEKPALQPCRRMETLVSGLCDDTLSGLAYWYTRLHILHCSKCRAAFNALRALRERLKDFGSRENGALAYALTGDRRSALEEAMNEIDQS